jgi:hypothetical protein
MLVHDAIRWIAKNEEPDLGGDQDDYIMTVCLVADMFRRKSWEIARCVHAERAGLPWRLGHQRQKRVGADR